MQEEKLSKREKKGAFGLTGPGKTAPDPGFGDRFIIKIPDYQPYKKSYKLLSVGTALKAHLNTAKVERAK